MYMKTNNTGEFIRYFVNDFGSIEVVLENDYRALDENRIYKDVEDALMSAHNILVARFKKAGVL